VVASDRSLGGFGHTWGEHQPKVQLKKRLLEEEGIIFEEGSNKIRIDFFVESADNSAPNMCTEGSKRRKSKESTPKPASTMSKSKYFTNEAIEEKIKQEIITVLQMRQPGKTC
jgi:hypothetical protein